MITFDGYTGEAGESFNGRIIDIDNIVDGPVGYFTVIPISPWSYRKKNATKAKYSVNCGDKRTMLAIIDDWGTSYILVIDNDDPALDKALAYFAEEHIPEVTK